jgi:pimeloyl-ACP methyl ester carboxylesterase
MPGCLLVAARHDWMPASRACPASTQRTARNSPATSREKDPRLSACRVAPGVPLPTWAISVACPRTGNHLGLERFDLLGHSAGANVAVQYAVRHQRGVSKLALITPSGRAAGLEVGDETRREVMNLRRDEPWFAEAAAAFDRGAETDDDWRAIAPSSTAAGTPPPRLTGPRERRRLTRMLPVTLPPTAHSTRRSPAPRSPSSARLSWYSLARSIRNGLSGWLASSRPCSPQPVSWSSQTPVITHGLMTPNGSSRWQPRSWMPDNRAATATMGT